jgi:hypothetical protein
VDCLKTDVIREEEEQLYFSQFETIKSEPLSDEDITELNSPASDENESNLFFYHSSSSIFKEAPSKTCDFIIF